MSHRSFLKASNLAFFFLVIASYAVMFLLGKGITPGRALLMLSLGVVFYGLGTAGWEWAEKRLARPWLWLFMIGQTLLASMISYLGEGNGWLLGMPLIAQAVMTFSLWGSLSIAGLFLALSILPFYLLYGPQAISSGLVSLLAAIVFVTVFTRITVSEQRLRAEGERLARELEEANRQLREYAVQAEELAVVQERNRLAREIHDSLGHFLTTINMQIKAAQAVVGEPDRAADALGKAQALAENALADVRRSVAALRESPVGERPLPQALEALVAESQAAGIDTRLVIEGAPRRLPPPAELALYRLAQEGLTNVRKHAQARSAALRLVYGPEGRVTLCVQDDGQGAANLEGGYGLLGLSERAQLLGGMLRTHSTSGEGFGVEMEIPG
jgi:signal transduction histidine kinase